MSGNKRKIKKQNKKAFRKLGLTQAAPLPLETVLYVCKKCGKKLKTGDDSNPAKLLQEELALHGKMVPGFRCELSGCMDLCPKNEIAVALSNQTLSERERVLAWVPALDSPQKMAQNILEKVANWNDLEVSEND